MGEARWYSDCMTATQSNTEVQSIFVITEVNADGIMSGYIERNGQKFVEVRNFDPKVNHLDVDIMRMA